MLNVEGFEVKLTLGTIELTKEEGTTLHASSQSSGRVIQELIQEKAKNAFR